MAMARPWLVDAWPDSRPGGAGRSRRTPGMRLAGWLAALLAAIQAHQAHGDARTARGDGALAARQSEFESFFRRHERDIFTYLWRLTSDEASAYDLTQETFLRAWQHYDKVAGYERPGGWLFRVATNLALNHLRRTRSPSGAAVMLSERDRVGDDPARRIVESDQVRRALTALAPRQRASLVLREVYGLTGEELAATLGVSAGAAKTLLWRARAEFRTRYLGDLGDAGQWGEEGRS